MKAKLFIPVIPVLIIAACSTSRTNTRSVTVPVPVTVTSPPPNDSYLFGKPAEVNKAPGNEELAALLPKYNDLTLGKLEEGHAIYTTGACIGCHGAANVYNYDEIQWKYIIDDMAARASISEAQKDAVYKYVLALKATQAK
ncbi:MAG TPA: cytochrome c [Bacteroidia bacterium]|jgi:hypothetical protein